MNTFELNQYLKTHVERKQGDFLSGKTIGGIYAHLRNDASIYCWSGMQAVVKHVAAGGNYCSWMCNCASYMQQHESQTDSERNILSRAIHCVQKDGDDLCDEQSVGWYLAVYTYMHCLAFGRYDFEALFVNNWQNYFTEEYQQKIRG